MNAKCYLHMLEDYMWPIVSGRKNIDELVFMHNGTPPHFALSVRTWLDSKFPGHWLGRGPHEWLQEVQISCHVTFPVGLGKGGVPGKTSHKGTTGGLDSERYHQRPT